ncbi:MAG: hypothetical protein AB1657_01155 [Candidatus Micrarchaeota archaeon]
MRRILLFLGILAAAFAWVNPAASKMMEPEYDYVACNAQFARGFVEMRENCALVHEVPVLDSSGYLEDIDDALADAQDAIADGNRIEFGAAMWTARTEMLSLGLAIIGDAFQNKTAAFRRCVDEGTMPLKDELETCRAAAFEKGKEAAHEYLANDLERGQSEVAELEAMGADTLGMERILEYGEELDGDIDAAYDSQVAAEVVKLYQRHSRLVLLFRLEKMMSIMDYAETIIEAGSNSNKEELLEEIADLKGDTEDLIDECAYSPEVGSGYGLKNGECWSDALALMARFNGLQALYWSGR